MLIHKVLLENLNAEAWEGRDKTSCSDPVKTVRR